MKIRSLLLGSVAAAGLATTGFAADLGVVTSLDICDELGLSGLTISSDDNCLVITGGVTFEYKIGDYNDGVDDDGDGILNEEGTAYSGFLRTGGVYLVDDNDGILESNADVDAWLKFVATANSDFGPATATIKLISENNTGTADWTVGIDEAWVGIGDTTMLMAGYKGSIFNDGDDAPLNYLGLFNSSSVDAGVGFSAANARGGDVIQVVSNLGNGLSISAGIEDLGSTGVSLLTGVGVIAYAGDGVTAHASGSIDTVGLFNVHAGFKGTWDPITVVGAVAVNNGWWNALGSASATFDMFTIAVSGEATSAGEWGAGGSVSATVSDGVTINLGSRVWVTPGFDDVWQAEAGISAAATETITVTAALGAIDGTGDPLVVYGKAGLAWAPGGGFTSSIEGKAQSNGAYSATFKAAKTIK
ncbi:MAG: hypothetical protein ABIY37_02290 [Devosia sp.]